MEDQQSESQIREDLPQNEEVKTENDIEEEMPDCSTLSPAEAAMS
jgi:hypothetical protein